MRVWLAGGLIALSLIFLEREVRADTWRPAVRPAPVAATAISDASPNPIVTLGRPEAMNGSATVSENRQRAPAAYSPKRSEEHTSELQSPDHPVCRLLTENKTEPLAVAGTISACRA